MHHIHRTHVWCFPLFRTQPTVVKWNESEEWANWIERAREQCSRWRKLNKRCESEEIEFEERENLFCKSIQSCGWRFLPRNQFRITFSLSRVLCSISRYIFDESSMLTRIQWTAQERKNVQNFFCTTAKGNTRAEEWKPLNSIKKRQEKKKKSLWGGKIKIIRFFIASDSSEISSQSSLHFTSLSLFY